MIQHLQATLRDRPPTRTPILAIIGQMALWAFYALYAVIGLVLAIYHCVLVPLHRLVQWIAR